MTTYRVTVALAVFASTFAVTTAASAYFPSRFAQLAEQSTSAADTHSSSMSSSSASATTISSEESSNPLFHPVAGNATNTQLQQASCMQLAANKRENTIAEALDDYYKDMSGALNERHMLILQAWNNTDPNQQRLALQSIWRNFGMYWKESDTMMQAIIRYSWVQYQSDRANCGLTGYDPELGGLGADSQF
ncbi:MAG TPA: hypothetical protein VHA78_04835 [Candidatus Peribacteraceae bacterium]|nr:hypothetical protein [Candidatus Peribacteraceae bacterium]